ncbi:4'-phosphopantetheinyl transferase superfamily protein [Streptomyces sp. RKAG293]|uniref:4'-phosphopantetheinyl transferase family protein n=1 Tax=Streptomyces sp. RKAG293 TaxID=2893403 RepID=UPI0020348951|nr:4'-phosphopantetheinyl transferase superfamily protein [Streptomyces sp. RKAG293]MCM2416779.1 4'-phosphopantetheinyl transferase superfamily protein [Streptomyces sp. RKAG293]
MPPTSCSPPGERALAATRPLALYSPGTGHPVAHLWTAEPAPRGTVAGREWLSRDERNRLDALLLESDRALFVTARVLLRTALSRCVPGVGPAEWAFRTGSHGRPEVLSPRTAPRLRFNISHTRGLAACLVCPEIDCGLDVECLDRSFDPVRLARSMLSAAEADDVAAAPGGYVTTERFIRYWTLKEAYSKGRGLGLSLPTGSYSFRLGPPGPARLHASDDDGADWQFGQWLHGPGHMVAVAMRRGPAGDLALVRHPG